MELLKKLNQRKAENNPVKVGIIGCGQMGSGLAHAIHNISGMCVNAIADIQIERVLKTYEDIGRDKSDVIVTSNANEAVDAIKKGKAVATDNAELMVYIDNIEANVEATGITEIGAKIAWKSIMNNKPIVMLNVETDITVGPLLNHMARKTGSLYTVASGDEPGVCKMLYEQAILMGFEVTCIGKGKNNPIDYDATPETCLEEAEIKEMNPKILASFKDGTKTMVEMAAVSNATGLIPDVPGMHGPKVELEDLLKHYIPAKDGGIFSETGRVDYSTGAIAPGVFLVVHSEDKRIRTDMKFITKEEGPYYLLFRPYHLCDLETPQSIAEAVLLNEVTVASEQMNSEVVTIAKRNMKQGEILGGIGSADIFGRIYPYEQSLKAKAIPLGIAPGAKVIKEIPKGSIVTEEHVLPLSHSFIYSLRQLQNKLLKNGRIDESSDN
jgi:predicted homoserine dehydrogenase-like protein